MCSQIGSQCRERRVGLDNRVTYMYTQSWSLMQYSSKCIAIHFWWGVGLGVALNLAVFSWIVGFYHSNAFYFWRLWIPIDLTAPIVLIRLLCTLGHWESTSQVENAQQHHSYYDQSYTQTTCTCMWYTRGCVLLRYCEWRSRLNTIAFMQASLPGIQIPIFHVGYHLMWVMSIEMLVEINLVFV